MGIAFGSRTKEGTYPVIEVKDPSPLFWESDTNLKSDHKNVVPVVQPDQRMNRKFKSHQIPTSQPIVR
jgi:hypothetical protein